MKLFNLICYWTKTSSKLYSCKNKYVLRVSLNLIVQIPKSKRGGDTVLLLWQTTPSGFRFQFVAWNANLHVLVQATTWDWWHNCFRKVLSNSSSCQDLVSKDPYLLKHYNPSWKQREVRSFFQQKKNILKRLILKNKDNAAIITTIHELLRYWNFFYFNLLWHLFAFCRGVHGFLT